ncbi:hypothetical protein BDZ89DRAFT_1058383 [Hymenopellis radicata]|nr:hypothetical protein BDZ89DRAFT_1058383 [Hymenopellis radicata]
MSSKLSSPGPRSPVDFRRLSLQDVEAQLATSWGVGPQQDTMDLTYELPSLVRSLQDSWLLTGQSATLLSAAFAIIAILLLLNSQFLPSAASSTSLEVLFVFSYCSVVFNSAAAISAFVIVQKVSDVALVASRQSIQAPKDGQISVRYDLLRRYGVGRSWPWVVRYWILNFFSGMLCVLVQLVLQVWLHEGGAAGKIVISALAGATTIPLLLLIIVPLLAKGE